MAMPLRKAPTPQAPAPSGSGSIRAGWIAVAISVAIESYVAVFAGAESAADGSVVWGEVILLAIVTGASLAAVTIRNGGAAYAALGALALLFLDGVGALLIGVPMMAVGGLFLTGMPKPRELAVWILAATPVLVAIGSAIVTRLTLA